MVYGINMCGGDSLCCPQLHPVPAVEPVGHADGGPVSARGRLHLLQGAAGRGGHAAGPRLGLHPLHHPHRRRRLPRQGGHRQAQRWVSSALLGSDRVLTINRWRGDNNPQELLGQTLLPHIQREI